MSDIQERELNLLAGVGPELNGYYRGSTRVDPGEPEEPWDPWLPYDPGDDGGGGGWTGPSTPSNPYERCQDNHK
jgi:hypothetical protein